MQLSTLDWSIIIILFIVYLAIGLVLNKRSGSSSKEFFLSGRNMPWWLLGVSMVATTFAADTPGLITNFIRGEGNGVYTNWNWWCLLLTGMLTVFVYARLWRRLGVTTDLEFYELRYGGKAASFLRGFRAIYLGLIFNVITMAGVCLAGIKIGAVLLGLEPHQTLLIAGFVTVLYSLMGGLRGIIITDMVQFIIAIIGSVAATIYIIDIPEVGGLDALLSHASVAPRLGIFPEISDSEAMITIIIIPFAVQWWSIWYPGAEPGGGGYVAQRMLAAKDEKHATWATLFFNFAHYAIRPWPWILVALASLVVFPDLQSIKSAFPLISEYQLADDVAYSAMLTYLPHGLLGLVIASLIAAFMSTISTQLNWGSSYLVNDFYHRFVAKDASEKHLVNVGRIFTVALMLLAAAVSLSIREAKDVFDLMLQVGAGTGLLFILRWFWDKINPYSEIVAMTVSFIIAVIFFIMDKSLAPGEVGIPGHIKLLIGVAVTTVGWLLTTLIRMPDNEGERSQSDLLHSFKTKAFGPAHDKFKNFGFKIAAFLIGTIGIYSALFATGYFIYGQLASALIYSTLFIAAAAFLIIKSERIFSE